MRSDRVRPELARSAAAPCLAVLVLLAAGACAPQPQPLPPIPPPPETETPEEPEPEEPEEPAPEPEPEPEKPIPEPVEPEVEEPPPEAEDPDLDPETGLPLARPPLAAEPVPLLEDAVLPRRRIVAFYGNPASARMGILGQLPPEEMLAQLDREVEAWERADPSMPVQPALHLISVMATGDPGPDSLYRLRMPAWRIEQVKEWADTRDALLFLDVQPARSTVRAEVPRLERWLSLPDVHLALDPEWNMGAEGIPAQRIGSMTAEEINWAIRYLAELVEEHDLPPKVLVVHRFTWHMVRNAEEIVTDPRVQVVMHMDGWGGPDNKLETYRSVVAPEATQFTGFKLFYVNDVRGGERMLRPEEILELFPIPVYIQYQ